MVLPMRRATSIGWVGLWVVACCTAKPPTQPPSPPQGTRASAPDVAGATAHEPAQPGDPAAQAGGMDAMAPFFTEAPLARALDDFHVGRNLEAANAFEAFCLDRTGDPRVEPARLVALLARHDAGIFDPTAAELEALASRWTVLADYGWFYAASCHFKAGRPERAEAALGNVPADSTLAARALALRARSLGLLDRRDEAIAILEEASQRHSGHLAIWTQLADLRLAQGNAEGMRVALRELASRAPTRPEGRDAARRLGRRHGLSPAQLLRKGKVHFDAQNHPVALAALKRAAAAAEDGSSAWCRATVLWARTLEKMKKRREAWPVFERALRCEGDALADATFSGGRNRLRAGDLETAERVLSRNAEAFGDRSTADDVALMRARIQRKKGADDKADAMLLDQLARWPDGDMADEGAWALLWPRIQAERWTDALAMADRILSTGMRETSYRAEGRVRYWRGRTLAHLGRGSEALADCQRVLEEHPLSWYGLLAYARLRNADEAEAQRAVAAAMAAAKPPPDPLASVPAALWGDGHFQRGLTLARMGLLGSARRELSAVATPDTAALRRAWVWTRVSLFDRVGAHDLATGLSRRQEPLFGAHWPVGHHEHLWRLAHPRPYGELVRRWSTERGIDPHWVWSIMREESGFNPKIESWANAIGLMQMILPTARGMARGTDIDPTRANLRRPEVSVQLGTKYLKQLLAEHPLVPLASAGYNAGGGAMRSWRRSFGDQELDLFVENIPYREARGYAKRVTRSVARYTWLYDGQKILSLPLAPPGPP